MSAGCVVVTTPSGIQGIDAVHGEHCLIGTTSEELARHVTWLLQHPQERSAMGQAARQLMEETHTWQHVYDQIDHVIDRVLAPGEHHGQLRV
jgi:glycosyltransferase involved in cell wall biosynthesis